MDRIEFLKEIFNFFRVDAIKNEHLLTQYDLALSTREPIDWQKLYQLTLRETETRTLPTPKWFRDMFYRCQKIEEGVYGTPDGTRIRMILKHPTKGLDIREAETYHISYTLEEMKRYKQKQYGDKFISFSWWDDDNLQWVRV